MQLQGSWLSPTHIDFARDVSIDMRREHLISTLIMLNSWSFSPNYPSFIIIIPSSSCILPVIRHPTSSPPPLSSCILPVTRHQTSSPPQLGLILTFLFLSLHLVFSSFLPPSHAAPSLSCNSTADLYNLKSHDLLFCFLSLSLYPTMSHGLLK